MAHDLAAFPNGSPSANLLWNGNHDYWDGGTSGSYTSAGGITCDDVYLGPGQGATVTWSRVTNDGSLIGTGFYGQPAPYWLRFSWAGVATQGESQYLPNFRYTFMERYMTAPSVSETLGRTATMKAWLRANGPNFIHPIVWYNLHNGDYLIIDSSGISVTTTWTQFTLTFALPAADESAIDPSGYLGAGFDFVYPTAPIFDIGPMSITLS